MPFYFRFDCADYMREPSDIAVGGREFYVCDFKVMSLTIIQSCTSVLNFTMFFNDITFAGPQCCCFHRGRSLRKKNWVRIDLKMSPSEQKLILTIMSGEFSIDGSPGARASPTSQMESTSPMLEIFLSATRMGTGELRNTQKMIVMGTGGSLIQINNFFLSRFHVAVFANDGNLLAEFECPHVKVLENNIKDRIC